MRRESSNLFALIVEIALLVAVAAAAEAGVRWYAAQPGSALFPDLSPWPITSAKYMAYRRFDRPVDVLVMGMSEMMRLNAERLAKELSTPGHVRTGFNFAAPLQTVEYSRRLLADVLIRLHKPRVVVYGLIPTDVATEMTREDTAAKIDRVRLFSAYKRNLSAPFQRFLLHDVGLVRYRDSLSEWALGQSKGSDRMWIRIARLVTPYGDTPVPGGRLSNPDGLIPSRNEWRRLRPLLNDFPEQLDTSPLFPNLLALARTCRAVGIQLVLVNNPVHEIYHDLLPRGAVDHQRFLARVRETGAAAGVPVFDPTADGLGDPGFYVDATHHNNLGMVWLTGVVAEYLRQHDLLDDGETRSDEVTAMHREAA